MKLAKILDGIGVYGSIFHFSFASLFFGLALLAFIYLWKKGRLDMDQSPAEQMLEDYPQLSENESPLEEYSGGEVSSGHAPILTWLKWVYVLVPFWGIICLWLYWNGSYGWLDPGYWNQLQKAANTTYPYQNSYRSLQMKRPIALFSDMPSI